MGEEEITGSAIGAPEDYPMSLYCLGQKGTSRGNMGNSEGSLRARVSQSGPFPFLPSSAFAAVAPHVCAEGPEWEPDLWLTPGG